MRKNFLKLVTLIIFLLPVVFTSCTKSTYDDDGSICDDVAANIEDTWAIYIYLVDNEKSTAYNNNVIKEIGRVTFDEKVKVVCETSWGSTFEEYMDFCANNVDSDHKVLIVCGEGDERKGLRKDEKSFVSYDDVKAGLKLFANTNENLSFDLVFIDASYMACKEMAKVLNGHSRYLVSFKEKSYENKGFYNSWFSTFVESTNVSPLTLGKNIVDAYTVIAKNNNSYNESIKLSLINIPEFKTIYDGEQK